MGVLLRKTSVPPLPSPFVSTSQVPELLPVMPLRVSTLPSLNASVLPVPVCALLPAIVTERYLKSRRLVGLIPEAPMLSPTIAAVIGRL